MYLKLRFRFTEDVEKISTTFFQRFAESIRLIPMFHRESLIERCKNAGRCFIQVFREE